jgi:hypothetical protein
LVLYVHDDEEVPRPNAGPRLVMRRGEIHEEPDPNETLEPPG